MRLPDLPGGSIARLKEMVSTRGINYSDNTSDGDLAACENLSARRWPYLTARNRREQLEGYSGVTALAGWNKLVAVSGTNLLYDGTVVGTVTAGEKHFIPVNTKLVVWEDKAYLDLSVSPPVLKKLGADATGTGASFTGEDEEDETTKTMTMTGLPEGTDLTALFNPGDAVEVSGCEALPNNNRSVIIASVTTDSITIDDAVGFDVGTETNAVKVERKIPDMDFVCESGNRLWGCDNATQTIWASALGDPTNFYVLDGRATGSYAFNVATEGNFTGCCKLSSSVLFWKEHCLHKVLGSYPAEYYLYSYEMEGLRAGCEKSLVVINDVLHYVGVHGVFTYAGGSPADISLVFGNHVLTEAVGGTDGEKYWLDCLDNGEPALYLFYPNEGCWLKEDAQRIVDIVRNGDNVYLLKKDGTVWKADAGTPDPDVDWSLEYTPFYDLQDGKNRAEGRKRVTKLLIRVELPAGAWMKAETATDSERWTEAGKIVGPQADMELMVVPPNRGDVYRVKLSGHGPCTIKNVLREYVRGGSG